MPFIVEGIYCLRIFVIIYDKCKQWQVQLSKYEVQITSLRTAVILVVIN